MLSPSSSPSLGRLSGIFVSIMLGPCLIAISFFILYSMEYDINLAKLCKQAPQFSAATLVPNAETFSLVALTGTITIEKDLETDSPLVAKKYLAAASTTEVYAWEEHQKAQTASSEGRPPAMYLARWTTTPQQTHTFEKPDGHTNPEMHQSLHTWLQPEFLLGAYHAQTTDVQLPALQTLRLTNAVVGVKSPQIITERHLYETAKDTRTPHIGALRKSFSVLDVNGMNATLFCKVQGNQATAADLQPLVSFETSETLHRLFLCTPAEAIKKLSNEYNTETNLKNFLAWFLLVAGFLCLLAPLSAMVQGIFLLSGFIDFVVGFVSLTSGTAVFVITKLFVKVLTAPLLSVGLIAAMICGAWILFRRSKKNNPVQIVSEDEED